MGQYHKVYNLDRKEFIHPHKIDCGLKLVEQMGFRGSIADALFLLVANSNGRGGGDVNDHPMIGRWAGDRIVVQFVKEFQECFVAFKSLFVTEYDGAGQDTGKWLN